MSENTNDIIQLEIKRKMGIISLNYGDLNIFNEPMIYRFNEILHDVKDNRKIRVVVIKSNSPKAFSAGFDLKEFDDFNEEHINVVLNVGCDFIYTLKTMPKPTIALINGYAIGIGFLITLACDFRWCTKDAKFQLPEINYELMFPTHGGCTNLPKIVKKISDAKYLLFTGERIDAQTALKMGIVDRCFDNKEEMLHEGIKRFAKNLAMKNPMVMALIKGAIEKCANSSLKEGLDIEKEAFGILKSVESDRIKMIQEFVDKYIDDI
ncbi:MAG: enoyl-CoA hydratase/isomerase family protein [Candidatus Helarchaeota archaeon]